MKFLLLTLALFCAPVLADELVAKNGTEEVHLVDAPCVHAGTLGHLKPEDRPAYRKAWASINGKHFYACWVLVPERRAVLVRYEDGDMGLIPANEFRQRPGV